MRKPTPFHVGLTMLSEEGLSLLGYYADRTPPGDLVVCGTKDGGDVLFMAEGQDRNIVVIDSFEGLSEPSEQDGDTTLRAGSMASKPNTIELIKEHVGNKLELYKMWINADTIKKIKHRPIAMLWMDLDFYAATKVCLDHFLPDMVNGGVILCHDYNNPDTPGINKALASTGLKWRMLDRFFGFAEVQNEIS